MSTKKSHHEKLLKMKAVIESSIAGAKTFITGNTLAVKMPDGSLAHARDGRPVKLVYASGHTQEVEPVAVEPKPQAEEPLSDAEVEAANEMLNYAAPDPTQDEPPAKHSRNARGRKWWNMDPWERSR